MTMHMLCIPLISLMINLQPVSVREVPAAEILAQINAGEAVLLEGVRITGDLDLTQLTRQMNDAVYPERGKTAYVFSNQVTQPVVFRRCTFAGRLIFCRKETLGDSLLEYRVVFMKDVTWDGCVFEQVADFELTNFEGAVSLSGSTFLKQPRFVRIGLTQSPDLTGLILPERCLYKRYQHSRSRYLTAPDLQAVLQQP